MASVWITVSSISLMTDKLGVWGRDEHLPFRPDRTGLVGGYRRCQLQLNRVPELAGIQRFWQFQPGIKEAFFVGLQVPCVSLEVRFEPRIGNFMGVRAAGTC